MAQWIKLAQWHTRLLGLMVCVVAALALAGCGTVEKPYVIDMTQTNSFFPATLVVPPGARVVWKNRDHIIHATVSTGERVHDLAVSDSAGGQLQWDSGDVVAGGTYELTFLTPGTYLFSCPHHREMVGTIIVTDAITE